MKIIGSYHAHAYTWFVNQESEVKFWILDLAVCGYILLSQSKELWKTSVIERQGACVAFTGPGSIVTK